MAHNSAASPMMRKTGNGAIEQARAYILDDDPLMAGLLARRLARRGIDVSVYGDGDRLIDDIAESAPAVLFTDLKMPRIGGAELIGRAREAGFAGLVVLVTASRENTAIAEALRRGADLVLAKPPREFDLDWLAAKVCIGASVPTQVEHLHGVLEYVEQGALVVDEEGVPRCVNRRARDMLGIAGAAEAIEALERFGIADVVMDACTSGIVFVEPPGSRIAKRGPLGVEVHPIGAEARKLRIVLLHDFSEHRRLDDLQAQFAAYLSHRMRTPLTSVRNAVSILCGLEAPLDAAERERFLDIGNRNIERLVSSLDEIQKAFMAESGEVSGCRSLVRIGCTVRHALAEIEHEGVISGYSVHAPEAIAVTSRSRLREYIRSTAALMAGRLESAPHIDCVIAVHSDCPEYGGRDPEISIVLTSDSRSAMCIMSLGEYIVERGGDARLALERLSSALGGELSFPDRETVRLAVPGESPYDRELDLVQPLHLMLERARLSNAEFNITSVRAVGGLGNSRSFARMFADSLHALFSTEEALVSQGDRPLSFTLFTAGVPRSRIAEAMESIRERLARSAQEEGDEVHPSLRWEIAYHCDAISGESAGEHALASVNLL